MINTAPTIKYCLYARKSLESDERQAISIDLQIKEMSALAVKEQLQIVDTKQESHSAKISGAHEPLITKELFDKVQKKLQVPIRPKWGEKYFLFKDLFKCAYCGASIVAEEKFKIQNNN